MPSVVPDSRRPQLSRRIVDAAFEAQSDDRPSRVSCTIDFDRQGRQHGLMTVPHSRNDSAWGSIQIPITQISNGDGPTVLLTAGSHGDEYEGPIALMKLARELAVEDVAGRVLIMPCLNLPAVRAGTRLSPIDGRNMNRVFPGSRDGTVTEVIADFVYRRLLPLSDIVLDIHSGGKTLDFVPSAVMHFLEDETLMATTLGAIQAFGAPVALVLRELDNQGMLDTAVEEMGKIFISTELGGNGTSTASSIKIAERGVRNVLVHFGVLGNAELERPVEATRLMGTPDGNCFSIAGHGGMLEMAVELGQEVEPGQVLGRIYDYEDPAAGMQTYTCQRGGMVISRHTPGLVQRGDCLAVIAEPIDPAHLPRID
jgi:N-alpha-acetyl-L-2,4-diaminobutyrate deacetylase